MSRKNGKRNSGSQRGKKRDAQRRVKRAMQRKGGIRTTPSYLGGGRGVQAFRKRG